MSKYINQSSFGYGISFKRIYMKDSIDYDDIQSSIGYFINKNYDMMNNKIDYEISIEKYDEDSNHIYTLISVYYPYLQKTKNLSNCYSDNKILTDKEINFSISSIQEDFMIFCEKLLNSCKPRWFISIDNL
jgi:hypothetical protein